VDNYLPTETGDPPLANARKEDWNVWQGDRMEYNTMPGWAGSSWYFLRYMDPGNKESFCDPKKSNYWGQVDLYIGGAEHATGHLLYSRFWTKFLYDMGFIGFEEPFAKMINQGMILGRSSLIYRFQVRGSGNGITKDWGSNFHVTSEIKEKIAGEENEMVSLDRFVEIAIEVAGNEYTNVFIDSLQSYLEQIRKEISQEGMAEEGIWICPRHVSIDLVNNDILNIEATKSWQPDLENAVFLTNVKGDYICGHEVEKMSKRWHNVANPDDLCEKYGADTLRLYEMFLGPLEQAKPWDTNGISGVHGFLRKTIRLFQNGISEEAATKDEQRSIHKTIKKVSGELDRYTWNTVVSAMMICVNELTDLKCNKREVLEPLSILLSPYAPHLAEELWRMLGKTESVVDAPWPGFLESHIALDEIEYPVSINGKMRFKISLPADMPAPEVEAAVLAFEKTPQYLEGRPPKKVIVVPRRIVNIVV
jgi:leucyl-tRNA synthetase